jgi:hypothetical protein
MFFGAWLSAVYGHWIWVVLTILVVAVAMWFVLEDESAEELTPRTIKGFLMGLIVGVTARVLGALAMVWAFGSWSSSPTTSYDSFADMFRVILNGNVAQSLIAVVGVGLVGAFIAYALPYFAAEREEE